MQKLRILNKSVALGTLLNLAFNFRSKFLRIRPDPLSAARPATFRIESDALDQG
jgi:hypothetical protein